MRSFYYIFICCFLGLSFQGIAQEFADKDYYLVDSLVLAELPEADLVLLESSLKTYHSTKDKKSKINALTGICENMMHEDWSKYQFFQYQLIEEAIASNPNDKLLKSQADALNNLSGIYKNQGNSRKAMAYSNESLAIYKELGDQKGEALCLNNIGFIYNNQGDIPKALEYYHKSLSIQEDIGDQKGIAYSLNNIGAVYDNQGDIEKALEYYKKSLSIQKKINDEAGMAASLNNIGYIYDNQKDFIQALTYYHRSLTIYKDVGEKSKIAILLSNIGMVHDAQGETAKALEFYNESLTIHESIGDKEGVGLCLNNMGYIQLEEGKLSLAQESALKSLTIAQELGFPSDVRGAAKLLSEVYEKQGKGIKALKMYKLFITMSDSINNTATQKATAHQQAKYEYEKQKVIDDAEHDKLLAIEQEEKEQQRILAIATGIGLGLVIIFLLFAFNRLRITKKQKLVIEAQKQEVEQQKVVVELAHHELEEKNREILDSITYAKRIQSAILPPVKVVKEYLQDSFILYKPKDIVAGDFYWMEHIDGKVLFAAADCTGHGVPGAMVSVVCNNALNRSVREYGLTDPGQLLDKAREIIIQEFDKSDEDVKDGMDIALCTLEGNTLHYAGANNPLWLIRNGELIETRGNKQPVGQFFRNDPYTTHNFELEKGDTFYIFSDGYVDQFGGEKGKKFKAKAFRELLLSVQGKTMKEQKTIIDETFETWKGALDQIDDVCVMGIRV